VARFLLPPSFLRNSPRRAARVAAGFLLLALAFAITSSVAAAGSSARGKLSAHLTKTSFTSAQASKVKLVYKFSVPSKSFAYLLTIKKGTKWPKVVTVKKNGRFSGSQTMTVKRVFAGKAIKVGSYRLRLSCDYAAVTLSFRIVKAIAGPVVVVPKKSAPVNTSLPTISGTTKQGQTLSASHGSWSNSPTAYAYRWDRCTASGAICADIGGATSSTYVLALGDVGSTMRVIVTAANSHGSKSATSSQTAVVAGLPPANTAPPAILGTVKQGQTLSASNGSWSNSPTSYAYQWRRCDSSGNGCSSISAASSSTYLLRAADVGSTIRVVVTASNAYGSANATSAQTATVVTFTSAVSAGFDYSCALSSNGTIKCWGYNGEGELGNGSFTDSSSPVQVSGITDATAISAGNDHTCALISDGTVECWGDNTYGQLGNGTSVGQSSTPVQVTDITSATAISSGSSHSCALLSGGPVKCWGLNGNGELGNTTTTTGSSTPVQVSGLASATEVSASSYDTCALISDGTVKCWGDNGEGQLGDGVTDHSNGPDWSGNDFSPTPVQVSGITSASEVSAGGWHGCVLVSGGTVKCWGGNSNGELGNGTTSDSWTPVSVYSSGTTPLTNVTQVSAGSWHSCAVISGGSVECWGYNSDGELGNGATADSSNPVQVSGIASASSISAGGEHSCSIVSGSAVECWGDNYYGELGNGEKGYSLTPVQVSNITDATAISSGDEHFSCALVSGGKVECWGYNEYGQLGNGTTTDSSIPVTVYSSGTTPLANVTHVSAGGSFACALISDGTVWCWGDGSYGQLGNGTSGNQSSTPVQVSGIDGTTVKATAISTGIVSACAVLSDHTARCWGWNRSGELGNGTTTDSSIPVTVYSSGTTALANVTQVSAADDHTCALTGGTVKCWGDNGEGELGDGVTNHSGVTKDWLGNDFSPTPVAVSNITNATAIGTSKGEYSCALISGGTIECWGQGGAGELGNGLNTDSFTPVQVSNITSASAVGGGEVYSCAVLSGGAVECWGSNEYGQLGNGTTTSSSTPVQVGGITSASAVDGAYDHSCALISGGTVECWGDNYYGQLGNGEMRYSPTPVGVIGLP
jgi:alpha-tubulin suppressor-like RCC1 family protein